MISSKFVSRGGEKLEYAISSFKIEVRGKNCADFGSSTGGFVDCLLRHGAAKVYAVEKGYGVLAWHLRNNPQVIVKERTNALYFELPEKVDLITIDTGWTKQEKIVPRALAQLKPGGIIISLIKPHYEAGQARLSEVEAERVCRQVLEKLKSLGTKAEGVVKSPLVGEKGKNVEFLALLKKI